MELAYLNGVFSSIAEAKVSIEDRGFQFGDGVYEVIAAYEGKPLLLDRHLVRLRRSAEAIRLEFDFEAQRIEPIVLEGIRRCGFRDVMVYVQLTRGVAPRSHVFPKQAAPTVVMTFKSLPEVPVDLRLRGARAMTTLDIRWAHCSIKAITLLPNVLAKNEAIRRGYDEAIFVSLAGEVRECTLANVFAVRESTLLIPPRNDNVLHGVTQGFLMECAESIGLPIREKSIHVDVLKRADEAFMSGTTIEVLGITSIDGEPVGEGKVGDVTLRLLETYRLLSRGAHASTASCG